MPNPTLQERLKGMIWGQFIGDAAALGTHWIYDLKELDKRYPRGIQGFETPKPTDYHAGKKSGELTHYGVAALAFLRSLVASKGFSATDFGAHFVETFASPDYHGYRDRITKETILHYHDFLDDNHPDLPYEFQDGSNSDEINVATRMAPLLAMYWDEANIYDVVEAATKVTQNNEWAIAYMSFYARSIQGLLNGSSLQDLFQKETIPAPHDTPIIAHIRQKISQAIDLVPLSTTEATLELGQACPLPQSYPSAIQSVLKHQNSFTDAITATLRAGGDNAGRAALVGTWMGAHLGIHGIPKAWIERLADRAEINHLIDTLLTIKTPIHL